MTKLEIAKMAIDYKNGYYTRYSVLKDVHYKYRGKLKTRQVMELTEEGKRIRDTLDEYPVFQCPGCGKMCTAHELELWTGDSVENLLKDWVCCSICYEDAMGDDL